MRSINSLVTLLGISILSATLTREVVCFAPQNVYVNRALSGRSYIAATKQTYTFSRMSEPSQQEVPIAEISSSEVEESKSLDPMDAAMAEQEAKMRRAQELREQEVFIQRSTGVHECSNCGFKYEEKQGLNMIGENIPAGTPFSSLPSNWRCPTCRATKDSFNEITEEIPGFAVNQGYGFGGNSLTSGQKNTLIFGGLGLFFVLFLSGYLLS